jgi:hypothetical protein
MKHDLRMIDATCRPDRPDVIPAICYLCGRIIRPKKSQTDGNVSVIWRRIGMPQSKSVDRSGWHL